MTRAFSNLRKIFAPALAVAALTLTATASATTDLQPKPSLKVEGQRTMQGAKLAFLGKNWPANATILLTGTRAPGAGGTQNFGKTTADSTGSFEYNRTVPCTTDNESDAMERVTITAADSASGTKVTFRIDGSSWRCM